jgi:hypothetical protein
VSNRWSVTLAAVGVALLTFLVFLPAVGNQFVNWDDYGMVLENPWFRGLGALQLRFAFTTTWFHHYHPLTWLSYGVDHTLWGMDPRGYHLTSVVIHAASAAAIFLLARRLLRRAGLPPDGATDAGAVVAALAFALHPLRVEAVAWVTARRDVLSGLFFFLALLVYVRAIDALEEERHPAYHRRLATAMMLSVMALLSKSITMTLPLVLLLLDVYPLRRSLRSKRVWLEKLLFGVPACAVAVVALWAVGRREFGRSTAFGAVDRIFMAAHSFGFYLWKTLVPANLSPIYEVPLTLDVLETRFVVSAVAVVVLTTVAIALRRRAPWALAAWAYHVLTILPVSGLTHAGFQLAYDRYTYLPGLAWALLGGGAVAVLLHGWRRARVRAAFALPLCLAAVVTLMGWTQLTWRHIGVWHDSHALWTRALLLDPDACAVCHHGFGLAWKDVGHYAIAEQEFRTALTIRPTYTHAYLSLADVLQRQGRHDEALAVLADAERMHRDDPELLAELAQVRAAALRRAGRS